MEKLIKLLNRPKIIGIVANVNEGKSNLIYAVIRELQGRDNKNIYTYGLKEDCGEKKIYSVSELEDIKDSVIIIDEMMSLFDLDNRKVKTQIENTLRLIHHQNNILILCGLPENFKKFICGKVTTWIIKKVTIADFINGSSSKRVVLNYKGNERGTEVLNLGQDEALLFETTYDKIKIPYVSEFDTKKSNKQIVKLHKNVPKSVPKNVQKTFVKMCNQENVQGDNHA